MIEHAPSAANLFGRKENTMKIRNLGIATIITVAGLVAVDASAASARRGESRMASSHEAIASLTPVGAAAGWGRIKAEDHPHRTGVTKREIDIELYGLDPSNARTRRIR